MSLALGLSAFLAVPCQAAIWYVDANQWDAADGMSWSTAFQEIQQALDAAVPGDEVWVTANYYSGVIVLDKNDVALRGGFAGTETDLSQRNPSFYTSMQGSDLPYLTVSTTTGVVVDGMQFLSAWSSTSTVRVHWENAEGSMVRCRFIGSMNIPGDSPASGLHLTGASVDLTMDSCFFLSHIDLMQPLVRADDGASLTMTDTTFSNVRRHENLTLAAGIQAQGASSLIIQDSTFTQFSAFHEHAAPGLVMQVRDTPVFSLERCRFENNIAHQGDGVCVWLEDTNATVVNSVFYNNKARWGAGGAIAAAGDTTLTVTNSTLYRNLSTRLGVIAAVEPGTPSITITNSILWNHGPEVWGGSVTYSCIQDRTPGTGNVHMPPLFVNGLTGNLALASGSPCIDAGDLSAPAVPATDILGNPRPGSDGLICIGAYESDPSWTQGPSTRAPMTIHVRASASGANNGVDWANAFTSFQNAMLHAMAGDTLWVASGTYNSNVIIGTVEPEVAVYGGFNGTETLLEQRNPSLNVATIRTGITHMATLVMGVDSLLDGVTVRDGRGSFGAGIAIDTAANVVVRNCVIRDNQASRGGSGIAVRNANATIDSCYLYSNRSSLALGGGLYALEGGPVTVLDTTFEYSLAWSGGGIELATATAEITGCIFIGNIANTSGGGILLRSSTATIEQSNFQDNRARQMGGGLAVFRQSDCAVEYTTFDSNIAAVGGGLAIWADTGGPGAPSSATFNNVSFLGNHSTRNGGAVYSWYSEPGFVECTFDGNTTNGNGGAFHVWNAPSPLIDRCTIINNTARGTGAGILASEGATPVLLTSLLAHNTSLGRLGTIVSETSFISGMQLTVAHNRGGGARVLDPEGVGSVSLVNSILWNFGQETGEGVDLAYSCSQDNDEGGTNIGANPRFIDPDNGDFRLQSGSPCIDAGDVGAPNLPTTDLDGNARPGADGLVCMGAYETAPAETQGPTTVVPDQVFVDSTAVGANDGSSWGDAYTTIHHALIDGVAGREIWVAGSPDDASPSHIYSGSLYLNTAMEVYGGFEGVETLRAQRDWTAWDSMTTSNGVGSAVYFADGARLDGFRITDGHSHFRGGGVLIDNASGAVLANCDVHENAAILAGNGIAILGGDASILDCTVRNHAQAYNGGGIHVEDSTGFTISGCDFHDNFARSGGGVQLFSSVGDLVNSTFTNCNATWRSGGALLVRSSTPSVENVLIANCNAVDLGAGIAVFLGSGGDFENITIEQCSTTNGQGGAIAVWGTEGDPSQPGDFSTPSFNNVTINNCHAIHGGGAVHVRWSDPSFTNIEISGCTSNNHGGAIHVRKAPSGSFANCVIANSVSEKHGSAVFATDNATPDFRNTLIHGGVSHNGLGAVAGETSFIGLLHTTVAENFGGGAYGYGEAGVVSVTNSILWNHGQEEIGLLVELQHSCSQDGVSPGAGNIAVYPRFVDPDGGDFTLQPNSPCIDRADITVAGIPPFDMLGEPRPGTDGLADMGAFESDPANTPGPDIAVPGIVYVDASATGAGDGGSWLDAATSIRRGQRVSTSVDEIWVAEGFYNERLALNANQALYGGFVGAETIRSQRDPSVYGSVVSVTPSMVLGTTVRTADKSRIDGMRITGGQNDYGGGLVHLWGEAVVEDCVIHGSVANIGGGGVYVEQGTLRIAHSIIEDNQAFYGGGLYGGPLGLIELIGGEIRDNTATDRGGGAYLDMAPMLTDGASILHNRVSRARASLSHTGGGGIYAVESASIIRNSTIAYNAVEGSSQGGGGLYFVGLWNGESAPLLQNTVVAFNRLEYGRGAGIFVTGQGAPLRVVNSVLYNNISPFDGNAVYVNSGDAVVANSILFNALDEVVGAVVHHSCMQNPVPGTGNFSARPWFVDPENLNFRLLRVSPCIDRGDINAVGLPSTDIDGQLRIGADNKVDIGIHETPSSWTPLTSIFHTPTTLHVAPGGTGLGGSWGDAMGSVAHALGTALEGDAIWVAAGVYNEEIALREGVAVYGGLAGNELTLESRDFQTNETIIDADIGTLWSRAVMAATGARLDGFTITGGDAIRGGGLYAASAWVDVANCVFDGNRGIFGAGAHFVQVGGRVENSVFRNNEGFNAFGMVSHGGGAYMDGAGQTTPGFAPDVVGCVFENNSSGAGAGLHLEGASPQVLDTAFLGNSALYVGGGAGVRGVSLAVFHNATFDDCHAGHGGGGIAIWRYAEPLVIGGGIANCTTLGHGGAIFAYANSYWDYFSSFASRPTFHGVSIDANHAEIDGGGISAWGAEPTFVDCSITNNSAQRDGGGLYARRYPAPRIERCTFVGNDSANQVGESHAGAALHFTESILDIRSSLIASNTISGASGGGAIRAETSYGAVENLTIADNLVNHAISAQSSNGSIEMTNTILWNNSTDFQGITSEVHYSNVQDGSSIAFGLGNISANPQFVGSGNYRLTAGSPCIDAGIDTTALLDRDGAIFPPGAYDMGAYEFNGVLAPPETPTNVPTATNTPTPPPTATFTHTPSATPTPPSTPQPTATAPLPDTNPPAILDGPIVWGISNTVAAVSWLTNKPGDSMVEYGLTPAYGLVAMGDDNVTGHSVVLSDLDPATTYHFRASTDDTAGNGRAYSDDGVFTTTSAAGATPPRFLLQPYAFCRNQTYAGIRFQTDVPVVVTLDYGYTEYHGLTTTVNNLRSEHSIWLNNLDPSQVYYVQATVTDAAGNQAVSLQRTFRTLDAPDTTPPVILEGPEVIYLSDSTLALYWRTDESSTSLVDYGETSALGHRVEDYTLVRNHVVVLDNLAPDTEIFFEVQSADAAGNWVRTTSMGEITSGLLPKSGMIFQRDGVYARLVVSSVNSVHTLATPDTTPPVFISGPTVIGLSDETATLSWQTDEAATGTINYGIGAPNRTAVALDFALGRVMVLSGLQPDSEYQFTVTVTNPASLSTVTVLASFNTQALPDTTPPSFVDGPSLVGGENTVPVSWEADEPVDAVIHYGPWGELDHQLPMEGVALEHATLLVGLRPNTHYALRVELIDVSGNTTFSEMHWFRTASALPPGTGVRNALLYE